MTCENLNKDKTIRFEGRQNILSHLETILFIKVIAEIRLFKLATIFVEESIFIAETT